MFYEFFQDIDSQEKCQGLANTEENDWLDCLDDSSLKCFREAYVIAKVSSWDPVLITGPNGTGKTGYARLVWNQNRIWLEKEKTMREKYGVVYKKDILPVNCAAFSENLIVSELFGSRKGSFTGSIANQTGKIQTAHDSGKCLFLDEIGDLPMPAQAMLLRFFQDDEIQPLGEAEPYKVKNLKVVCATNRDLREEVKKGNFREDLYNRINKYKISVPPLKDRPNDCEQNYVNFFNKFKKKQVGMPWEDIMSIDREKFGRKNTKWNYSWPGNFRELQNRLQQAIVQNMLKGKSLVEFEDLFPEGIDVAKSAAAAGEGCVDLMDFDLPAISSGGALPQFDLEQKLSDVANAYIAKALSQARTKQDAAKLLGYSSYQKMDRRLSRKI